LARIADVVADLILLWAPFTLFGQLRDRGLRNRLWAIFSTCVATSIVSLIHAIFLIRVLKNPVVIAGIAESQTSLIVCNVPVIAAFLLRGRNWGDDSVHGSGLPTSIRFATLARKTVTTSGNQGTGTTMEDEDGAAGMVDFVLSDTTRPTTTTIQFNSQAGRTSEEGSIKHSPSASVSSGMILHRASIPKLNESSGLTPEAV
jgi:hypothetical protein